MFEFLIRKASVSSLATSRDVKSAYRLLLGREPDAHGFRDHLLWALRVRATPAQVAERFLSSAEYRQRRRSEGELVAVPMDGYSVFARRGDRLIGASIINDEPYEPEVLGAFKSVLRSGSHVLDVGANIGIFTMLAAAAVGTTGKVVAVEPLLQNQRALYAGVVQNRFANVAVLPFAASDKAGLISIRCAPDSSNGIVGIDAGSSDPEAYVPTHRLDDLLSTLPRLDVVKIDIEGHEPTAWRGMKALLERHRPTVFSEFSPIAMRNVGNDATEYLGMLFAYCDRIRVLHRDRGHVECNDAESVMREWRDANRRAGLDGELHLDLHALF